MLAQDQRVAPEFLDQPGAATAVSA